MNLLLYFGIFRHFIYGSKNNEVEIVALSPQSLDLNPIRLDRKIRKTCTKSKKELWRRFSNWIKIRLN